MLQSRFGRMVLNEMLDWRWPSVLQPRDFPDTRPSLLASLRTGGGESAWREFFNRYAPAVYRVARLRGLGTHDADDIVQQVMVSVSGHIARFNYDSDRGHFRQWVRRIADRKVDTLYRQRRPALVESSFLESRGVVASPIEDAWEREWKLQDMLYCLDQVAADISPRRMRAFWLYVLNGVSAKETARILGMTVGYVYVTRNQVLNLVRQRMRKLEESA